MSSNTSVSSRVESSKTTSLPVTASKLSGPPPRRPTNFVKPSAEVKPVPVVATPVVTAPVIVTPVVSTKKLCEQYDRRIHTQIATLRATLARDTKYNEYDYEEPVDEDDFDYVAPYNIRELKKSRSPEYEEAEDLPEDSAEEDRDGY
jgi:hypothetical protein